MFYDGIGIRRPIRPTLSVPSQSLSLISPTSTCSVKRNHTPLLGHPSRTFTPLPFHWLFSTCSCYLRSDDGSRTFGISSSLIDFYLIAFGTHMDISPTFLSSRFARSWCPFSTYSHFSFDIYLGAPFTIKTYIQLWNKPAFAPHSSELTRTHLNH